MKEEVTVDVTPMMENFLLVLKVVCVAKLGAKLIDSANWRNGRNMLLALCFGQDEVTQIHYTKRTSTVYLRKCKFVMS